MPILYDFTCFARFAHRLNAFRIQDGNQIAFGAGIGLYHIDEGVSVFEEHDTRWRMAIPSAERSRIYPKRIKNDGRFGKDEGHRRGLQRIDTDANRINKGSVGTIDTLVKRLRLAKTRSP